MKDFLNIVAGQTLQNRTQKWIESDNPFEDDEEAIPIQIYTELHYEEIN